MTQMFIKPLSADSSCDILLVSSPSQNHSAITSPPKQQQMELMDTPGCRLLTVLCCACIHACGVHVDTQLTQICGSYWEQWDSTDVGQPIKHCEYRTNLDCSCSLSDLNCTMNNFMAHQKPLTVEGQVGARFPCKSLNWLFSLLQNGIEFKFNCPHETNKRCVIAYSLMHNRLTPVQQPNVELLHLCSISSVVKLVSPVLLTYFEFSHIHILYLKGDPGFLKQYELTFLWSQLDVISVEGLPWMKRHCVTTGEYQPIKKRLMSQ